MKGFSLSVICSLPPTEKDLKVIVMFCSLNISGNPRINWKLFLAICCNTKRKNSILLQTERQKFHDTFMEYVATVIKQWRISVTCRHVLASSKREPNYQNDGRARSDLPVPWTVIASDTEVLATSQYCHLSTQSALYGLIRLCILSCTTEHNESAYGASSLVTITWKS
jgi:hypothetical protein